jgi:hypothetical protein
LRNLIAAGNPLPRIESLGPISLPHPIEVQHEFPANSVLHYATDTGVWRHYFGPGLESALDVFDPRGRFLTEIAQLRLRLRHLGTGAGRAPLRLRSAAGADTGERITGQVTQVSVNCFKSVTFDASHVRARRLGSRVCLARSI